MSKILKISTSCFVFPLPGQQRELGGEPPQRAAGAGDGRHHGGVLPGLLAALRSGGAALHLRPPRLPEPGGEHHAVAAGQVLHRHQPFHLHIHEQAGEAFTVAEVLHNSSHSVLTGGRFEKKKQKKEKVCVVSWFKSAVLQVADAIIVTTGVTNVSGRNNTDNTGQTWWLNTKRKVWEGDDISHPAERVSAAAHCEVYSHPARFSLSSRSNFAHFFPTGGWSHSST